MAAPTALFRFRIELADVDRSVYTSLDFRVAQHPSETREYLLTRVLAYALNAQDGLQFSSGGLSNPDDPCISAPGQRGGMALWIEVGNPPARKLHKASKAAEKVRVYTYKNPETLLSDLRSGEIHQGREIDAFSFSPGFLASLDTWLERENRWNLTSQDGSLTVSSETKNLQGELIQHHL